MTSNSAHIARLSLLSACLALASGHAAANPAGGSVVSGSATIVSQGNTVTVTNTPGAVINWQGFSIGLGETANFVQQSSSSAVLNRIVGQSMSNIAGSLQSNGRVFLINPNGALITSSATINTAGFTISTSDISNSDFIAGNHAWKGTGSFFSAPGVSGSQVQLSSSGIAIGNLSVTAPTNMTPDVTIASAGTTVLNGAITLSPPGSINLPGAFGGNVGTGAGTLTVNRSVTSDNITAGGTRLNATTLSFLTATSAWSPSASALTTAGGVTNSGITLNAGTVNISGITLNAGTPANSGITLNSGSVLQLGANHTLTAGGAQNAGAVTLSGATLTVTAGGQPNGATSTVALATTGATVVPIARSAPQAATPARPTAVTITLGKREPMF